MNAIDVKAECAAYWRFIRQMPIVAVEALDEDLLIVTKSRRLIICEVKISISDMRVEAKKPKHAEIRRELGLELLPQHARTSYLEKGSAGPWWPTAFYFAIPADILEKAQRLRDKLYPYAGILVVGSSPGLFGRQTYVHSPATELHNRKLDIRTLTQVVKAQSASIANAYARLSRKQLQIPA